MNEYNKEEILQFLHKKLHEINHRLPKGIPDDANFIDVWGLDSLDLIEFIAHIEEHFQIAIPDEDLEKLYNMEQITLYLEQFAGLS